MQKCPICGEEIDRLWYEAYEGAIVDFCYMYANADKNVFNGEWESIGTAGERIPIYCCPECDEVLFNREEEAKEFLKSGELPEHRIPYFVERKLSQ